MDGMKNMNGGVGYYGLPRARCAPRNDRDFLHGGAVVMGGGRSRGSPLRSPCVGADDPDRPMRCKEESPVTASPCQPPLSKGALGTGDADCHSQCGPGVRNRNLFLQGVRYKSGRVVREADPYAPFIDRTSGAASSTPCLHQPAYMRRGGVPSRRRFHAKKQEGRLPSCKDTKITYPLPRT